MSAKELILFDADRIKEYVFATGRLKEIRGASWLVRQATDHVNLRKELKLSPEQIIFAEGGSGLLEAPDAATAAALCQHLCRYYAQLTTGATLTAVHTPYTDPTFRQDMHRAAHLLQLAKESQTAVSLLPQTPFTALCDSCGAYPVTDHYGTGTALDALCQHCMAKRKASDALRTRSTLGEDIYLSETVWGDQFLDHLPASVAATWTNARLPENLTGLAALSRPSNYLALLYADGNALGQLVQSQTSKASYQALSQRITTSLQRALWSALVEHFPAPRGPDHHVPFELIALGGDDLILVTVADMALPLALSISERFTQKSRTNDPADPALTLSFGVVIAHPGQPILNLEQQARNLLSSAKQQYPGQAALDFHVVNTPILHDIAHIRAEAYTLYQHGTPTAQLSCRPYLQADLHTLLDHVHRFQQGGEAAALPRNKLHTLYQSLFTGEAAAEQEAFFLRSRLNAAQLKKFDDFFTDFGVSQRSPLATAPSLPWRAGATVAYTTPFLDLMELYPFIASPPLSTTQPLLPSSEEPIHALAD